LHRPILRHAGLLAEPLVLTLLGGPGRVGLARRILRLRLRLRLLRVLARSVLLRILLVLRLLLLLLLLLLLPERAQRHLEIAARVEVVGREAQGVSIALDGAAVVLLLVERVAEIEAR